MSRGKGPTQAMHDAFLINVLAKYMRARNEAQQEPYVLILGAGASLSAGASSGRQVIAGVTENLSSKDVVNMDEDDKEEEFYAVLNKLSASERRAKLREYIQGKDASEGYRALADLAKKGYFEVILTTNYDTFLEDSLSDVGLRRDTYALTINGADNEDELERQLRSSRPRLKVVKLHGDLYRGEELLFTPGEVWQFSEKLEKVLRELLRRDLIIVGHRMQDNDINRCIDKDGGSIWYVNPREPVASDSVWNALQVRPGEVINSRAGYFDSFFVALSRALKW